MHIVVMVLVFFVGVVVSTYVARLLPGKIPLPLLQIALGAAFGWLFGFDVELDPHLFFLLFIPPLLFLDGWRIPKGAFFRDWRPILLLAIGLVVFTVVGLGWLIHWMLPAVPLAAAFALAAILSPTDPVAVSAMTAGTPVPSRLMHVLEGESLLNDASGLVCFNFAVVAALTGTFSLWDASLSFLLVAGGGIIVGVAVSVIIGFLNRMLVRRVGEDSATQILVSLLIPFAAYLLAEDVGVSGVLAAVAAGIMMHYGELSGRALPVTRMQRTAVWDTVQATLNGAMFILLGDQLPRILDRLPQVVDGARLPNGWYLLGYVFAITAALAVLRFVWVMTTTQFAVWLGSIKRPLGIRLRVLTAVAGVKGAITLAGILGLPLLMSGGGAFPARDALIFLAMGVILLSLISAWLILPRLARGRSVLPQDAAGNDEAAARVATGEAALRYLEALSSKEKPDDSTGWAEALARLIDFYRQRVDEGGNLPGRTGRQLANARRLQLGAMEAERRELRRLRRERSIDDDVYRRLQHQIDLVETSLRPTRR